MLVILERENESTDKFSKFNEQNIADECTKCNAIAENETLFNSFSHCRRMRNVDNDVCECCLFKHRNQNCSINEHSMMMSIVQTFTRRNRFFIISDSRSKMRSTTKTFDLQINISMYLFVRSVNKQSNSTIVRFSTTENLSFTFVHFYESFFFSFEKNNFSARILTSTIDLSAEKNAEMKLNWSKHFSNVQKSTNDRAFVRVNENSKSTVIQRRYADRDFFRREFDVFKRKIAVFFDMN